ncbi:LytR/AlgR family response regulator transcription factor [Salinimicrobium oceani]|uniref:Response regulator transcription factor n=1 Tax=Salinimicrobium oceani TaxID=2722702 RepID=A0ABX1CW31_9FLAO|nr:LytTR family DNA-binding domain-containing protein [Salinimicrobium oceani]NJW52482.1 response regulator transcription factor [Salinimicrobium oceani]
MNSVVIEDEKPAARRLQRMLEKIDVQVQVVLHTVEEAIAWFSTHPSPELIFLDIQLSDGLSFGIFEEVKVSSPVIFTTAYDEYALQAFKLNSVDYLLKPIDDEELEAAVSKFRSRRAAENEMPDLHLLKSLLNLPKEYRKRFTIPVGQHLKLLSIDEVCCFYSENKGTYLYTLDGRSYLLDGSLDKLEPELDPASFFRVNRKFIVHLKCLQDIITYSNQRLEIKLEAFKGEQIIVSRERVKEFKEWLN